MTTVAIPFVRIDASQNPNLTVRSGQDPAEPYFKAMTVAFASVRRWGPEVNLEFISNAAPPLAFLEVFEKLGVVSRYVPFAHRPPEGFARSFTASLFMLDALESLTAERTIVMDPDVLCVGMLDSMLREVGDESGVLLMEFSPDEDINGISRSQASELHGILGEPQLNPNHFGGETYIFQKKHLSSIIERSNRAWDLSLRRYYSGESKFTTEEHILSYAIRSVPHMYLNSHVKRIWTAHKYRLVDGRENDLTLWHLPAEKDRGFDALYPVVLDGESWFWTAERDEYLARVGRAMGLHHRSPLRFAKDLAGSALHKLARPSRR